MRISVGGDDSGEIIDVVVDELRRHGHSVSVLDQAVWPDVAQRVAEDVADQR